MSYFAVALQALMDERSMTQLQLEERASVSQSQISLYRKDEARPTREALSRLCKAFGPDSVHLLIAFLRDEIPPEFHGSIEIFAAAAAGKSRVKEDSIYPPAAYTRLPKRVRDLIDAIAKEAEQSPKLLKSLEATVDLFRGR